jgi:lipopolysaccharide export system permease protein
MRIIDRYMLRQFCQVYFICFFSLTGLYVVIDAFGNLDEFLAYAEEEGGLLGIMAQYYGYRSLSFFDRISGVLALISAMFTITRIQRHQEMTALLAAGIPTFRIIAPVVIAAGSVSLLAAANREIVLPKARDELTHNAQDLQGTVGRAVQPRYDNTTDILLRAGKAYKLERRLNEPSFILPPELARYGKNLQGQDAIYKQPEGDRPAGWLFSEVKSPVEILTGEDLLLDGRPIIFSPHQHDWLKPKECFVASELNFDLLASGSGWYTYSSTADLIRSLRSPSLDIGNDVRVALHTRFVQPMLDVTLLFLGLPLILSRNNRNVFKAIGLCVAVAAAFMIVVIGCQYLGSSYLVSPAKSVWLPLMIFVPLAVAISDSLRE